MKSGRAYNRQSVDYMHNNGSIISTCMYHRRTLRQGNGVIRYLWTRWSNQCLTASATWAIFVNAGPSAPEERRSPLHSTNWLHYIQIDKN